MCTAINETRGRHLFGRTLDLDRSYGEQVVISPRRLPFSFIYEGKISDHYAIIGTACLIDNIPLYFDAMNENGLCVAALRFPDVACYHQKQGDKVNLASFEVIPWILCNFSSVNEAKAALNRANITSDSFSAALSATPLHWIVGDKDGAFVVESDKGGLHIYDGAEGILTNAPEFPIQAQSAALLLNDKETEHFPIPGDMSSRSRFIRATYAKYHTEQAKGEAEAISRFFHIMGTVNQPLGFESARTIGISSTAPMKTLYTSCMDSASLTYYFTTYSCRQIRGARLKNAHLDLGDLISFPMEREEWFHFLN